MTILSAFVTDDIRRCQKLLPQIDFTYGNVPVWRSKRNRQPHLLDYVSQTAGVMFSTKPGVRGLERRIGELNDIMLPKKGSLSPGMVI